MAEDTEDLERVVMLQRLEPDAVDDYIEAHDDVPDSVIDAMDEADVAEYELYVHDDVAVGIMEAPDLERFEEVYGRDPRNEEWERRVAEFKRSGVDPDEMEMPVMDQIWALSDDRE